MTHNDLCDSGTNDDFFALRHRPRLATDILNLTIQASPTFVPQYATEVLLPHKCLVNGAETGLAALAIYDIFLRPLGPSGP